MKTRKIRFILAGTSALLFAPAAFGQTGTWINMSGGAWNDSTNWAGGPPGVIASSNASTANFSSNISGNATVTLNVDRTIKNLNFSDADQTSPGNWIIASGTGSNELTLASNTATAPNISVVLPNNSYVQINALLQGNQGFTRNSGGELRLNNVGNTISGAVVLNQGFTRLETAALANISSLTLGSNSTLGIRTTLANAVGGTIFHNGGRLQYFFDPGTDLSAQFSTDVNQQYKIVTQSGVVATFATDLSSSGGSLDKTGPGTLILTADNTYTGTTTVSGTLLINGSTSATSAVSVAAAGVLSATPVAFLGGNGTINGTLNLAGESAVGFNNGGVLAPGGTGVDIQTLNAGTTTWNNGSIWNFDLSSINATSDKLNITGDFTKGGAGTYQFDFKGSTPSMNTTYTLVEWSGMTNFVLGDFSFTNLGGGPYAVSSFAFDGKSLTFTAVPEPPTAGFAGWIDGFDLDPADQDPTDDPDNDGIDNLLEFVLNGNPSVSDPSILPKLAVTAENFEFTYQRRVDSVSPETTQTFEWGTSLVTWPGSAVIPAGSGMAGAATITVSAGVPVVEVTDTVKISIPKTADGGTGKLFGRLQVVTP